MRTRVATNWLCVALLLSGFANRFAAAQDSPTVSVPFELRDGDRVVLVGGTFIEREGQYGVIETALSTSYPGRNITFRNLGWSGDTVWAESRGIFDPPAAGYKRMLELIQEQQPTVILLAYGQNESFAGEAGLQAFLSQYHKLCDDLLPTKARLVFVLPLQIFSDTAVESRLQAKINQNVAAYNAAITRWAAGRGTVIDLNGPLMQLSSGEKVATERQNPRYEGMHLTELGYRFPATAFTTALGLPPVNFDDPQIEALRQKIVEKNTLFFHRWRPANVTYLYLFRKHEQGNNAVEIPKFDPLIEAAEQEIAKLKHAVESKH